MFGLRRLAQELQDHLPRIALVDVSSVDGVEHDKDGAAGLAKIGQIAEFVGLELRRGGGFRLRPNKGRDGARLA